MIQSATVSREALLEAVSRVALVAPRSKQALPIAGAVLIEGGATGFRLTSTDFDRVVRADLPGDGAEAFPPKTVPCHRLAAVANQLPPGSVEIAPIAKGIRLTAGRARFDVTGLPAEEFPVNPLGESDASAVTSAAFDAPPLLAALSRAVTHSSDEISRPTISGVHVSAKENGRLRVEATNGHRLTREFVDRASGPELDVIIPLGSVHAITKLFAKATRITFDMRDRRAAVTSDPGGVRFETGLIEGQFPSFDHVIPAETPHTATVDRLALLTAVRRVAALSTDDLFLIRLEWSPSSLTVRGVGDADAGSAEDSVSCSAPKVTEGDPFRITFNARYLIDALTVRTGEVLHVGFTAPERAMLFRDSATDEALGLVMPRRDTSA